MADSNIARYEDSQQEGEPIECYRFVYDDMAYQYTSAAEDIEVPVTENGATKTYKFYADVVSRESIKPGSSGSIETCVIKVSKDNPVAKLFEGPPPEKPVSCTIYRLHTADITKFDAVLYARIGQVKFTDSECEMTADMESWLEKEVPNGTNQYYCNWHLFSKNCALDINNYIVTAFVDQVEGLKIYSSAFAAYADGYFTNGMLYYNGYYRMIASHTGNCVTIKYPMISTPRNNVLVVPGCNGLFRTCALKFNNVLNFSGVPYVAPTDPEKNPTGKGAYWIDSLVVQRDTKGYVGTISI